MALLLGIGLMGMQTVSAATLTLDSDSPGVSINPGSNSGSITGGGVISINIDAASGEMVDLLISFSVLGTPAFLDGGVDTVGLVDGTYKLLVVGTTGFNIALGNAVSNVPVPAAVWLFGSALMGLFGVSRRKSTALAA